MFLFLLLKKCFFFAFNVVFLLLLNQKRTKLQIGAYAYYAFLMGKDIVSWTERVFCSSIIDFIWFVLTVFLTWMDAVV